VCFIPIIWFVFLELGLHSIEREKFLKDAPIEKVNTDKQVVSFLATTNDDRGPLLIDLDLGFTV